MSYTHSTVKYKGYTIEIETDDYPDNPIHWSNLGTMICFHNRYNLGDYKEAKQYQDVGYFLADIAGVDYDDERFDDMDRKEFLSGLLLLAEEKNIILPLYLYDHSGITMNTTGFSCGWDSGQVGFIYVPKEKLPKEGWSQSWID